MNTKEILNVALLAGDILLSSGAETSRVEDTVRRICKSYNIECECFVTPTGIFVCTIDSSIVEDSISLMKRINKRSVDLQRIELINSFSRNLTVNKLSYEECMESLKLINSNIHYSFKVRILCAGITAFTYSLLFNGTFWDGLIAFLICTFIYSFKEFVSKTGYFQMFDSFISGIIAGVLGIIAVKFINGLNLDSIIIGSIMILVPGLVITSGIKDAIQGDMVSCTSRIAEALFIVTSVGAGVALVLILGIGTL